MTTTANLTTYGPFSNTSWSQTEWGRYQASWQYDGIIPTAFQQSPTTQNEFAVTANGVDRQLTVATGRAFIEGIFGTLTSTQTLDIAANSSGLTRVDRIILTVNWSTLVMTVSILEGTPGAGAPSLTQTFGTLWQMSLCQVTVANGASSLNQATITDERQPAFPPGNWIRIDSQVGTGASGTITHSNIPPYYKHLRVVFDVLGTDAATQAIRLRFNNDSAGVYSTAEHFSPASGSVTNSGNVSQTSALAGYANGTVGTGSVLHWIMEIPDYSRTGTGLQKGFVSQGAYRATALATGFGIETLAGYYVDAAVAIISRIDLILAAGNFNAVSRSILYGQV